MMRTMVTRLRSSSAADVERTGRSPFRAIVTVCAMTSAMMVAPAMAGPSGLTVSGQWFRLIIRSRPAAGYFTLSNETGTPQSLVGAASPGCGMLMLHKSVSANGEERMVMVPSVAVPAHGRVTFAPGGYHLMCMSPTSLMKPGQSVPVTLRLANGETVNARFPVRGATGAPARSMGGMSMPMQH
jgi:periplasmic copper chaperone A